MLLSLLVGLACSGETPRPAATTPPTEPAPTAAAPTPPVGGEVGGGTVATVPTLLGDAPGVAFLGDWTSASCGGRAYARNMHFDADNSYAGIDLVSPCPKGTTCVWSGMVGFAGIWKQDGTKLNLREIGAPIQQGGPHPTMFESTTDGKLVENGCIYERGLTVPEGYDALDVTPRIPGSVKGANATPAEGAEGEGAKDAATKDAGGEL